MGYGEADGDHEETGMGEELNNRKERKYPNRNGKRKEVARKQGQQGREGPGKEQRNKGTAGECDMKGRAHARRSAHGRVEVE